MACDQQHAWEFVDPPPQDYYCPLCEQILKEPMLTDCCGSHFCPACIDPIITDQKPCPNPECKKEHFKSMIDKRTMNRILELDVLCPLKGRGCHWKGEMGTRDKHLDPKNENSCEYIDVNCTYGCGEDMEKYELEEHLNRFCPKRPHKCEHCDFEDVFDRIVKDHIRVCPKYPLPCRNNCGNEEIPRSDYELHLSECPQQDIECEFRYAGCVERIKRKDIAQHQQDGVYVHLSLQTAFATQQLTDRDRKIEEMSTTWEKKHQDLIEKLFHSREEEAKEREENSKRLKVELAQKDEAIERLSTQLHEKEKVIEDLKQGVKDLEVNVLRSQQDGHDQLSKKHCEFSAELGKTIQDQAGEMQVRFSNFEENTEAKVEQFFAKEENIKRQAIELEARLLKSQEDSQKKVSKKIEELSRSVEVAKEIKHTVRKQLKEVSDKSITRADELNEILKELDERVKAVEQSMTVSRSTDSDNTTAKSDLSTRYVQQKPKKRKKEHRQLAGFALQEKLLFSPLPTASGANFTPTSKRPDKRLSLLNDSAKIEALLRGMAKDWRSLGTQLLFSKEALDQIASVPGHATIHLNKLLNKWLLGDGASPTISVLVNALYSMKRNDKYVESILKAYDEQQHVDVTPATRWVNIKYPKEDNHTVNGSERIDQLPKESEVTFVTPASSSGSSKVTDQSAPLTSASNSPPWTSTTKTTSIASTVPVPLSPSPATPIPPPGLPSPAPAHSTLGGYNNGQPWAYTTGQDGVLFPSSGIGEPTNQLHFSNQGSVQYHPGVWNVPQDPRPPNQRPRGVRAVTPQLVAQRSPRSGDGMENHGEGGPRPAGVGTFNGGYGGNGATGMNFSQTVSGSGHDIAVTAQPHSSTHQTGQDNSGTKNSEGVSKTKEDSDECPICLSGFKDPVKTKCGHMFCRGCIDKAILHSSFCPICKTALRTIVGDQPIGGQMHVKYSRSKLPGYYDCGTIEITYYIPSGVQGNENPRPGHRYQGATRTAYLPNNFEGNEVLQLLKRAFDARLIFTVGTSVSSGQTDVVTWNDVHHKTNTHGGPQQYGYPDPTYLARVKADLAAKGIVTDDSTV